jgi:hypothetical protein
MRNRPNAGKIIGVSLVGGSLLSLILLASMSAAAQAPKGSDAKIPCIGCSADGKTTPRTADGHPDLSGFWNTPRPTGTGGQFAQRSPDGSILYEFGIDFDETIAVCTDDSCQEANQPPYKTEYLAKVKEIGATEYLGTSSLDPEMLCRPLGVPRTGIGGMQIVQTPQLIALLYEGAPSSVFRIVYTDGRPHPKNFETSYMGDSIGHWEGDTLVVDVAGLNDDTWLGSSAHGRAKYTSIHSEKEHVIERWTRDGDTLTYQATVEDPVMFTKPWVLAPRKVKMSNPGEYLEETICSPSYTGNHMVKPTETDKGQLLNGSQTNTVK